jgi:hypothetical protein
MNKIVCLLCCLVPIGAFAQQSQAKVLTVSVQSFYPIPAQDGEKQYLPSLYYDHQTDSTSSIGIGVQGLIRSGQSGIRAAIYARRYFSNRVFNSFYGQVSLIGGVQNMPLLYEGPDTTNQVWIDDDQPLSFLFIPFWFAESSISWPRYLDVQKTKSAGAAAALGYRLSLDKRQHWVIDGQIQLSYNARLTKAYANIEVNGENYTPVANGKDNPYSWSSSFLGSPLRAILTVGYRF